MNHWMWVLCAYFPMLFIHEGGHFLGAALMGFTIKEFKVFSWIPRVHASIRECWAWQQMIFSAAGPAASILPYFLIGGKWSWALWVAEANHATRFFNLAAYMSQELHQPLWLTTISLFSLLFGVINLVPFPIAVPWRKGFATDGWEILKHGFNTLRGVRYVYKNKADDQE